jgi:hypothetical protein
MTISFRLDVPAPQVCQFSFQLGDAVLQLLDHGLDLAL